MKINCCLMPYCTSWKLKCALVIVEFEEDDLGKPDPPLVWVYGYVRAS